MIPALWWDDNAKCWREFKKVHHCVGVGEYDMQELSHLIGFTPLGIAKNTARVDNIIGKYCAELELDLDGLDWRKAMTT